MVSGAAGQAEAVREPVAETGGPAALELRDVVKRFEGHEVIRGVNLAIRPREAMTIIGGSGAGKSVLLRLMIGLIKPDQGRILIEGRDIVPLRERELLRVRCQLGMIFQGSALFDSMTVGENVAFALREHTDWAEERIRARVRQALDLVGLGAVEGMDPAELSGGMKKRVAVARAVALPPRILFYDEPTTGLDPSNVEKVVELIMDLKSRLGVTSVVVTHDMPAALKLSDRVAMLHEGRIAAMGSPQEILASQDSLIRDFMAGKVEA